MRSAAITGAAHINRNLTPARARSWAGAWRGWLPSPGFAQIHHGLIVQEPPGRRIERRWLQRRQAEAAWNALEDGSAVDQVAEAQARYDGSIERLKQSSPGMENPECIETKTPIVQQIAAIYGEPALGWNPELLQMAYEAVGGAERWEPDPDEERWLAAIPQQRPDAFSR